jgi:hypothetical protein
MRPSGLRVQIPVSGNAVYQAESLRIAIDDEVTQDLTEGGGCPTLLVSAVVHKCYTSPP